MYKPSQPTACSVHYHLPLVVTLRQRKLLEATAGTPLSSDRKEQGKGKRQINKWRQVSSVRIFSNECAWGSIRLRARALPPPQTQEFCLHWGITISLCNKAGNSNVLPWNPSLPTFLPLHHFSPSSVSPLIFLLWGLPAAVCLLCIFPCCTSEHRLTPSSPSLFTLYQHSCCFASLKKESGNICTLSWLISPSTCDYLMSGAHVEATATIGMLTLLPRLLACLLLVFSAFDLFFHSSTLIFFFFCLHRRNCTVFALMPFHSLTSYSLWPQFEYDFFFPLRFSNDLVSHPA